MVMVSAAIVGRGVWRAAQGWDTTEVAKVYKRLYTRATGADTRATTT